MQARFYLPQFGRFSAPDPARDQHFEDTQSWNIYSYVRNSPVMSTDPTGMVDEDKKNATETKGPQGGMSGTDDYSRLWQNDWNKWAQAQTSESAGQKVLKAWAAETDPVAASLMVNTWDKKGSVFGTVGEDHGVGHVAIADPSSGAMLLSQFPANGKPGGPNVPKDAQETKREEGRGPDHSFMVDVKDRGAFARQALSEAGKKMWTPLGIFGTQCAVSSTKSLFAGGSGAVDRSPFRWPASLTRRLDGLAGVPGSGVTHADPKLVNSMYGN